MIIAARLMICLSLCFLSTTRVDAQAPEATTLHTILKSQKYVVGIGDLVQIRYKTQATAVGIATLDVRGAGPILEQIAVVTMPLDPAKPENQLPGSPYFVVALMKVVKAGSTTVDVTPIQNDGAKQKAFTFSVETR